MLSHEAGPLKAQQHGCGHSPLSCAYFFLVWDLVGAVSFKRCVAARALLVTDMKHDTPGTYICAPPPNFAAQSHVKPKSLFSRPRTSHNPCAPVHTTLTTQTPEHTEAIFVCQDPSSRSIANIPRTRQCKISRNPRCCRAVSCYSVALASMFHVSCFPMARVFPNHIK